MFSASQTFVEKLRDKLNHPAIKAKIEQNSGHRMFDALPAEFDTIFSNTAADAAELGQLLKKIPADHTEMDNGHVFRFEADTKKIERWAKRRISRICRELLTKDNSIKAEVLHLLNKTKETLSAQDLVFAYYSAASQYIGALVNKSDDANYIDINVHQAFIEYNTQCGTRWILSVLLDRIADPDINYNERDTHHFLDDNHGDFSLGVLGGIVATLCVVGLTGGIVAYQAYKNRQNNTVPDTDKSESPSYGR